MTQYLKFYQVAFHDLIFGLYLEIMTKRKYDKIDYLIVFPLWAFAVGTIFTLDPLDNWLASLNVPNPLRIIICILAFILPNTGLCFLYFRRLKKKYKLSNLEVWVFDEDVMKKGNEILSKMLSFPGIIFLFLFIILLGNLQIYLMNQFNILYEVIIFGLFLVGIGVTWLAKYTNDKILSILDKKKDSHNKSLQATPEAPLRDSHDSQ